MPHLHTLLVTALLAVVALGGCKPASKASSSDASGSSGTAGASATTVGQPVAPAATGTPAGETAVPAGYRLVPFLSSAPVRSFKAAGSVLKEGTDYQAVMDTSAGRMVIDLYEDDTPVTVNSFVWLALHHYFDGLSFHRVVPGFVVQGGDPTGTGSGGPGYQFGLEVRRALSFDAKGVIGMARTQDPNSNGSQFYITLAPTPSLNGQYTVFGRVVSGLEVLDRIERDHAGEPPSDPATMTRVSIVQKAK